MADPRTSFPWTRALVTGASGGIGEAMARRLAAAGVHLVVVARSGDRLEALATDLRSRHGVQVDVVVADLAEPGPLATVEARAATGGDERIDLLVNNAGYGRTHTFGTDPVEEDAGQIALNVTALTRLSHAAVTQMAAAGSGTILNVSSTASFQPTPTMSVYGATKAYVTSLSQALHEELRGSGIVVTALCPGPTHTDFVTRSGATVDLPSFLWQSADEVAQRGLEGAADRRAVVVSGAINAVQAGLVDVMPRGLVRRASRMVFERVR